MIDFEALFGELDYDPCAALQKLRPAYMELLTGGSVARITFRDRTTEWHRTDIKPLETLITQLEADCAAKRGVRGRRRAITAGASGSLRRRGAFTGVLE